jgi:D-3-phosphoglycerate dehydrogenase
MIVYLGEYIHPDAVALLKKHAAVVDTFDAIEKIDGIISRGVAVPRDLIRRAVNLKVISKHGVGYNQIDVAAAREFGKTVIYTPSTNIHSVAELLVGMILDVYRHIAFSNMKLRTGEIKTAAGIVGNEIAGKTLALIGMGNVARLLAKILNNGFGLGGVSGYDPYAGAGQAAALNIKKCETIGEAVRGADIVNVSVPLTDETRNLITRKVFDCCKPSAILVNASRGGIVNEDDLYAALKEKKLKAAACDVFAVEPPAPDNKLLSLDNFCATPHIGGSTEESLYRTGMETVQETINVINGLAPKHPVP